jgi:hypothetical protein
MHRLIVAGICVFAAGSALDPSWAEPVLLGDEALKSAVIGKTVHLDTPFGVAIPITYHGNGLMSGKAGVLEYLLGAETDRGRWWVSDGRLCQKWFKWLDAKPNCMRVRQDGTRIFWQRDDGLTGTATITSGLAQGAEAAPRGLGGPVEASAPAAAPPATEPMRAARPAVPHHHHDPAPAVTATHVYRQEAARTTPGEGAVQHATAAQPPAAAPPEQERWCLPDTAAAEQPAPDLVMVARLAHTGGAVLPPMNACLAAEPALRYLARIGIAR